MCTDEKGTARAVVVRSGAEPRVRREPAAAATGFGVAQGFRTAGGLRGRFRRRLQEVGRRALRPVADGAATKRKRTPDLDRAPGGMAERSRHREAAGARCRGQGRARKASSSRRRRPRRPVRFTGRTAVILGKNSSFSLGFPGRGLGFCETKNPLPGGSGLRMRSLGAPQLFHFPCAQAARFVVVTWLICQEETACRRTKARVQSIVWIAGAA